MEGGEERIGGGIRALYPLALPLFYFSFLLNLVWTVDPRLDGHVPTPFPAAESLEVMNKLLADRDRSIFKATYDQTQAAEGIVTPPQRALPSALSPPPPIDLGGQSPSAASIGSAPVSREVPIVAGESPRAFQHVLKPPVLPPAMMLHGGQCASAVSPPSARAGAGVAAALLDTPRPFGDCRPSTTLHDTSGVSGGGGPVSHERSSASGKREGQAPSVMGDGSGRHEEIYDTSLPVGVFVAENLARRLEPADVSWLVSEGVMQGKVALERALHKIHALGGEYNASYKLYRELCSTPRRLQAIIDAYSKMKSRLEQFESAQEDISELANAQREYDVALKFLMKQASREIDALGAASQTSTGLPADAAPPRYLHESDVEFRAGVGQFLNDMVAEIGKNMILKAETSLQSRIEAAKAERNAAKIKELFRVRACCESVRAKFLDFATVFTQADQLHETLEMFNDLGREIITEEFCFLLGDTFRKHPDVLSLMKEKCPLLLFQRGTDTAPREYEEWSPTTCYISADFVFPVTSAVTEDAGLDAWAAVD